jgi:hypothetical protein
VRFRGHFTRWPSVPFLFSLAFGLCARSCAFTNSCVYLYARTRAHWRYGTDAVQVACWRPTAGPKRDVPTLDVCSLKIAVRVTLSRFTASLWIAVQERPL